MESLIHFLELSTIHGLSHISTGQKLKRFFWTTVVFCGFFGAAYMIYSSFLNWEQSPISTTIETLPISQITFPNVTVCPPKKLFLDLNVDFQHSQQIILDNDKREKLLELFLDMVQSQSYDEMINKTEVTSVKLVLFKSV